MDGDREEEPLIYVQKREERELIVTAQIVPGEVSDESLEGIREMTEHFQRSLATAVVVREVRCGYDVDDPETVWLRSLVDGIETDIHELAIQTANEVAGMSGVKDEVSAVRWQLPMSAAMARAQARGNDTIDLS